MWTSAEKGRAVGASVTIPLAASDVAAPLASTCHQMDVPVLVCCVLGEIKFRNQDIFSQLIFPCIT